VKVCYRSAILGRPRTVGFTDWSQMWSFVGRLLWYRLPGAAVDDVLKLIE